MYVRFPRQLISVIMFCLHIINKHLQSNKGNSPPPPHFNSFLVGWTWLHQATSFTDKQTESHNNFPNHQIYYPPFKLHYFVLSRSNMNYTELLMFIWKREIWREGERNRVIQKVLSDIIWAASRKKGSSRIIQFCPLQLFTRSISLTLCIRLILAHQIRKSVVLSWDRNSKFCSYPGVLTQANYINAFKSVQLPKVIFGGVVQEKESNMGFCCRWAFPTRGMTVLSGTSA